MFYVIVVVGGGGLGMKLRKANQKHTYVYRHVQTGEASIQVLFILVQHKQR